MPGWHEATRALREAGKVVMLGIIEEQHPDRCRLFMQWKEMGWPVLQDPLDLLGVSVVPITVAVDAYGVIRFTGLRLGEAKTLEERFLNRSFPAPEGGVPAAAAVPEIPDLKALRRAAEKGGAGALARYGDALVLWGGPSRLDEAVDAYEAALRAGGDAGVLRFRLGVAYRMRYDSPRRREGDFARAVRAWEQALAADPNQYIRRRRIQQYGPRLEKPYPFYDWIAEARRAIRARGEEPAALRVEPGGAEIARPVRIFQEAGGTASEPDPEGRIRRDEEGRVRVEAVVVPGRVLPGGSVRVHLSVRLGPGAHWNDEAGPSRVWVDPPAGWQADRRALVLDPETKDAASGPRRVEFELHGPGKAEPGRVRVHAYALCELCEDEGGTCLTLRRDFFVAVEVRAGNEEKP